MLSGVRLGRRLKGARFPPASSRPGHARVHFRSGVLEVSGRATARVPRLEALSTTRSDAAWTPSGPACAVFGMAPMPLRPQNALVDQNYGRDKEWVMIDESGER